MSQGTLADLVHEVNQSLLIIGLMELKANTLS